jgi:methylated-DNA-[protein]-cysteine S-methyltransferase
MAEMHWLAVASPIGPVGVAADGAGIRAVRFGGLPAGIVPSTGIALLETAAQQLDEYFAGQRTQFTLPLPDFGAASAPDDLADGSGFERAVWAAIATVPYGQTMTYGEIARQVGAPAAARAVGVACNHNPLPLVIACHRVVGAGGKLVGFGGGLPRKRFLLELELRVSLERGLDIC